MHLYCPITTTPSKDGVSFHTAKHLLFCARFGKQIAWVSQQDCISSETAWPNTNLFDCSQKEAISRKELAMAVSHSVQGCFILLFEQKNALCRAVSRKEGGAPKMHCEEWRPSGVLGSNVYQARAFKTTKNNLAPPRPLFWGRREWDSNPRYPEVQQISSLSHSTSLASLQ